MAYLPFYITPEEFSAYQEEQEQKILNGMNLTVWHKHESALPCSPGRVTNTAMIIRDLRTA